MNSYISQLLAMLLVICCDVNKAATEIINSKYSPIWKAPMSSKIVSNVEQKKSERSSVIPVLMKRGQEHNGFRQESLKLRGGDDDDNEIKGFICALLFPFKLFGC